MSQRKTAGAAKFLPSPFGFALLTFLAIGGYFLVAEHWAHLAGYLPLILLLAACGGMHFFMHGLHSPDDHDRSDTPPRRREGKTP